MRDNYQGQHAPPGPGRYGAPAHDLTQTFPDDIYGPNAVRYYGTGETAMDAATMRTLRALRGKPDAPVTIYRAVPTDAPSTINPGDWVTVNKAYAQSHGEGALGGSYRIVSSQVPAKTLWTSGDSFHEFGYHPQP